MDFSQECMRTLSQKKKEGIEAFASALTNYMRQCQQEVEENKLDEFETRWVPLLRLTGSFDPRKRLWTPSEFEHFPALLILKQQKRNDEFHYYMLRYRIDQATGMDQDKTMIIHEIDRKRFDEQEKNSS